MFHMLLFLLCLFKYGICHEYTAEFNDKVRDCKDFTNNIFQANLGLAYPEDMDDLVTMEGDLQIKEEIGEGVLIDIEILKATGTAAGYESMIHVKTGICESMKEEDAPWSSLFEKMGVAECPIAADTYPVTGLSINLDFSKNLTGDNYAGDYDCILKMLNAQQEVLSCHMLDVQVSKVS